MGGLLDLAYDAPNLFKQLLFDMDRAAEMKTSEKMPWKRADETVAQSRDRLRREREQAKARIASMAA